MFFMNEQNQVDHLAKIKEGIPSDISDMDSSQLKTVLHSLPSSFPEFSASGISGLNLDGKVLSQIELHGTPGKEVSLVGADLTGTSLIKVDWENANLSNAVLNRVIITSNSKLDGVKFSHASLVLANFSDSSFVGANFMSADLTDAYIHDCDMRNTVFGSATLEGDEFVMQNVDLRGANLNSAKLNPSVFLNIVYDQFTVWPQGFDPKNSFAYTCIYKPS